MFREAIEHALSLKVKDKIANKIKGAFEIGNVELTNKEAMIYAQLLKAITKQDTQAFNAIVDRVEGKPKQAIDHSGVVATASVELTEEQVDAALKRIQEDIS